MKIHAHESSDETLAEAEKTGTVPMAGGRWFSDADIAKIIARSSDEIGSPSEVDVPAVLRSMEEDGVVFDGGEL
jgi:hypothetical protein